MRIPNLDPTTHRACQPLIIDLHEVEAPTAADMGQFVALDTRLRLSGGHLVLVNVGERAHEALEVTGLTGLLDVRRAEVVQPG